MNAEHVLRVLVECQTLVEAGIDEALVQEAGRAATAMDKVGKLIGELENDLRYEILTAPPVGA